MDPKTVDCVIYHADCSDGFGAAWAAWKVLGNRAEYYAAKHRQPPPDVEGKRVLVLDYAYDKKPTRKLIKDAEDFEMRDHHKSAMIMLEGISKPDWFQLNHSGCILAWEYFHPGIEPPRFLQFVENRDMGWKPYMDYAKEFSMAFDMTPFDFKAYDRMLNASYVDDCIKRGAHILPYAEMVIDKACRNSVKRKLRGYNVLVTNATQWISETGMKLAPDCDFSLVWYWDHNEGYAKVSLRSFHPDVDCGTIAKRFGGGGHSEIAGFEYAGNIEELFGGNNGVIDTFEDDEERDSDVEERIPDPRGEVEKVQGDVRAEEGPDKAKLGRDLDGNGAQASPEVDRSED